MNTVPYASINVVEYAGPFPLMEFFRCYILQYFSPTTVLVLVCILSSSTQFTYFTLPCLFLQDQHKAEETVHPKIPLHFILSQPHTHVVRLVTQLHLPPNTQVLKQGGRQSALQSRIPLALLPHPNFTF